MGGRDKGKKRRIGRRLEKCKQGEKEIREL
jgi:hypothetical protein